ncbi:MAG TPA: citrate:proton symporter [Bryobacteraceae bacterium]|nr:citrate:proton symporter [Bryobacteraceae bacterium]
MLAALGFATILLLLALILSRVLTPLSALIAVPVVAAISGGFGARTGTFMVHGIQGVAGVAGMFIFAILYFGVMTDAGMLEPIIDRILRAVGRDPARIVMGTALLALLVHLDGSGAVTFLVTVPVMLPLYERLGMSRLVLAAAASLAAGVNFLPWTGPMIRASASLHIPVATIFDPLIPVQAVGILFVFAAAWWMGKNEARRLGIDRGRLEAVAFERATDESRQRLRRPSRFALNLILTLLLIAAMVGFHLDPAPVFMVGVVIALQLNYPGLEEQGDRIAAHAKAALMMAGILFAAGAFTGIMKDSGMLDAMAKSAVAIVPANTARHLPFLTALVSMPLSVVFDPDSFYFGVLPVLAQTASKLGVPPLEMAQAAMLGLHTTGFPVSPLTPAPFLLVGLAGVDFRDHQKFAFRYLLAASLVMTAAAVLIGIFPL